ncbi:DUF1707 domain-containing protein [Streptomonospora algeriensis]|uniref:DUF1707 domain-containing protein n=1 Tax=Streptomonospora algeriensis TaxID=995084 RepID=A0ABW3BJV1_9ACTN
MEPTPPPAPCKRVSDAERDRVAARLGDAFAEGRLGPEEFGRRNSAAYEAVFDDELLALLADLPAPGETVGVPSAEPAATGGVVELSTVGGPIRRRGDWAVPRKLRISSLSGPVRLDMSRARIPHSVVDIELSVMSGSIVLVLPDGATADIDRLQNRYSHQRSKVPAVRTPQAPHFVLFGETYSGLLRVRYAHGRRRR